jgi:hypothetical protein
MRFSLVFPHVLTADALDAIPALARIASYGRREDIGDADAAIARMLGASGAAIAPLAALGAGLDAGGTYVLRADPVTFVAGRDDVLLAGRVDDLGSDDAASLVETLNRHFASDGVAFHAPRADAWFATAHRHVPVEADALLPSEPIGAHLPRGEHGPTWRRWLSEMQMLLHEHPVNRRRERTGLAPATGIWVSGGGTLPEASASPPVSIHVAPSRVGDVAAGIARLRGGAAPAPPTGFEALARGGDALVVLAKFDDGDARDWLVPAVAALERGAIDEIGIVAVDGRARRYQALRPSWWRRMRMRMSPTGRLEGESDPKRVARREME